MKISRYSWAGLGTTAVGMSLLAVAAALAAEIPEDLVGRLEGRSSLGRLGLQVHSTAGVVDAGYKGHLTLELANIGKLPIKLTPGMRICQLVLEKLSSPAEVPYGAKKSAKYFNESGASQSKADDVKK